MITGSIKARELSDLCGKALRSEKPERDRGHPRVPRCGPTIRAALKVTADSPLRRGVRDVGPLIPVLETGGFRQGGFSEVAPTLRARLGASLHPDSATQSIDKC